MRVPLLLSLASLCAAAALAPGISAQNDLGLRPNQQPLFNPAPITPAPLGFEPTLTNLLNQAKIEQQQNEDERPSVFESTMWKAFVLAEEAAAAENWPRSDAILLKMHQLIPENIMLTEKAGRIFLMREAYEEAQSVYLKRFARNPENYDLLTQIGKCSLYQEDLDGAIKSLKIAARYADKPLEAKLYLAFAYAKKGQPAMIPNAFGALTLFESSITAYWLGIEADRHLTFLTETEYLQIASYILGGGSEGSLEVEDINRAPRQLLEVYRLLNQLDRALGQRRFTQVGPLMEEAEARGMRGLHFQIYQIIHEGLNGDAAAARAAMNALAQKHPNSAAVQHFHGVLLMLLADYTQAVDAFKRASELDSDHRISLDLLEAQAASGDVNAAFKRLRIITPMQPSATHAFLDRDTPGMRALKTHPDFTTWIQIQQR